MKAIINSKNTFIFDMDGTLVNLELLNRNSFKDTVKLFFNHKLTNDEYQKYFSGVRTYESFRNFIKENQYDPQTNIDELIIDFRKEKRHHLLHNFDNSVTLIDGSQKYLQTLRNQDKKIVLATSSIKEFTYLILKNLEIFDLFNIIITAEDVKTGKPDPEIYLKALERSSSTKDESIIFEDSKNGILSAKTAGVFCVGVHTKGLNDDYVHNADYVIENYLELL